MKNICICLTNRAHYGRLKALLYGIERHDELNLQLIVGGSCLLDKYGEIVKDIETEFDVVDKAYCVVQGNELQNMADTTSLLITKLTGIFDRIKPDIVLAHADRYEQLAVAITASYMNIPLAHTQGGEFTGSIDNKVRGAISVLADIHFPCTQLAESILKETVSGKVYNVGCTYIDSIAGIDDNYHDDEWLNAKYEVDGVNAPINFYEPYIVVSFHPNTDEYDLLEQQTVEIIKAVGKLNLQTVWLWPNNDAGYEFVEGMIRRYRERGELSRARFFKGFDSCDYIRLIRRCCLLVGNTSSGIREGSFLGVPYVCVGNRQIGRECAGNVMHATVNDTIYNCCVEMIERKSAEGIEPSKLYGDGKASKKICEILKNY